MKFKIKKQIDVLTSGSLLLAALMLFSVQCSRKQQQFSVDDKIVAQVGNRVITARDFKYSYEFSFAPTRVGKNPKKAYLNYMINELLLANEGYELGYNKSRYVRTRLKNRQFNNLLEHFFLNHVHKKVKIPEDKLKEAVKRGTVKFRLLIWPTSSLKMARIALDKARETSLSDYVDLQIANQEVRIQDRKFFETDWIDWLDLRPEIFEKVKDLEIGKTSEPIPFGNGYALIQVLDLHLNGITTEELKHGAKRHRMMGRLHSIQADSISRALADSLLTPLDYHVKGSTIEKLTPLLFSWYQHKLPKKSSLVEFLNTLPDTASQYLKELKALLPETLIISKNGSQTVRGYIEYLNYFRRNLRESTSREDFEKRLLTEIGNMIKYTTFVNLAKHEGYEDSVAIKNDLQIWEQKWTYDIYRHEIVKDINVSKEEMLYFFKHRWKELGIANVDTTRFYKYESAVYNYILHEKYLNTLNHKIAELRKKYPVKIYKDVLAEIQTSDENGSKPFSLFLRKNFNGAPVVPIVDPKWVSL